MTLSTDLVVLCDKAVSEQDAERAVLHLLDWVGIVLSTRGSEAEQKFGKAAGLPFGATSALANFGDTPSASTFALGALGSLQEMDDLDRASILHAGDTVCPAALCAALKSGASGPILLASLLAGYEVAIRIGRAAATGGYTAFYNSSTIGVFGAAMAASRIYGLDHTTQAYALGHAGMQAAGLWQCRLEPGHAKQLATAHAARSGITSADAAQSGLKAPLEILEGQLGFFRTLYPNADIADIAAGSAGRWKLYDVSLKPWGACRHTHPAIAAALKLRSKGLPVGLPQEIDVSTYEAALEFCNTPQPINAHEARFSLQHCVAVALVKGAPGRADFDNVAGRDDPNVKSLRSRISVTEDTNLTAQFPNAYGATLRLTDANGAQHVACAPNAPGDPEAPMSRSAIVDKFFSNCMDGAVSKPVAQDIYSAITGLTQAKDLCVLAEAFKPLAIDPLQRSPV